MKKLHCILCILLALALLPLTCYHVRAAETEGIVRVLLTRLNLTDTVSLALDGSYTLQDISFQRGSKLTVSSKTGSLMVYYEGMALDAGKTLTLKRHLTEDGKENGIRFNGIYELHPGDLVLSVQNGMIRAVLHAPVEEYLQGVVPYEMSDSFPLEALKAQAITARTYALRKVGSSADYDVVDNTNDQAYMGVKAENKRAAQAIEETAGICGVYKGKLAECFYSASNGGQTELVEHVWGAGDYGYFKMIDDPYDLENPESVIMKATLPKTFSDIKALGTLGFILMDEISEPLDSKGFDTKEGYAITGIESIELQSPLFPDSPSRLMTEAVFTLKVQGYRFSDEEEELSMFADPEQTTLPLDAAQTSTPATASVTVKLPIFSVVEDALSLSVNVTDNELITVTEKEDHFLFESRRYGHGVGMSQRGAQWMAGQYGKDCKQILAFYYPGMDLKQYNYSFKMPSAVSSEFLATPGPAATPTPRPTPVALRSTPAPSERMVIVDQIGVTSYLNLRAADNTSSAVLQQLYYGQKLYVTEDLGAWLKVRLDDLEGYVMTEFVSAVE